MCDFLLKLVACPTTCFPSLCVSCKEQTNDEDSLFLRVLSPNGEKAEKLAHSGTNAAQMNTSPKDNAGRFVDILEIYGCPGQAKL